MKTFVKALPVHEIIRDLATQFGVAIEEDCGELTIQLAENLGEGFIRGISFENGIGVIEYRCTFYKDMELHFTKNNTHPLKFVFCSKGRIDHTFEDDDEVHTIHTYQNIIVSSSGHNGHVLYFKANEITHVLSLEIIREAFNSRNNHEFKDLNKNLKNVFKDANAKEHFFYQGNYSIKAADIVDDINTKQVSGFLRSIFLEGKAFEMLVIQIEQYQDDQRDDKLPQILRRTDVEKVKKAIQIIENDLGQNFSVDFLAKEVGTNVNKLQDGFKYMFNLTVNKYMQQAKLEAAKEMFAKTDYNISQIVNLIGLNNRSYFSKVFKEKYGVSPKYFLKSRKDKEGEDELNDDRN
ncbi:MAG TPA: AraC family transcriptional regulator [Salinimicrobium sp.]|nr:AraC family transcriptional regulator [Salinimicrobium sp.]